MKTIEQWYPITYKNTEHIEEAFKPYYKGKGIFLDIGTNAGAVIDRVLNIYPNAHVEGFEPVDKFWKYLDNKYKNTNVTINKFGLGHSKFKTRIHVDPNHLGWNEIGHNSPHTQEIQIRVLDKVLEEKNIFKGIEFIKIDVEFFEPFVIAGLENYFKKNKKDLPHILIEHNYKLSPYKKELAEVYTWLRNYYNPFEYDKIIGTKDILLKPINK